MVIVFEDEFAVTLELYERVGGEDLVGKQGGAAVIGHSEAEKSVVGSDAVAEEFGRQLPVERRVEELAHANHHVAAHVWYDTQVVGHV